MELSDNIIYLSVHITDLPDLIYLRVNIMPRSLT